jgi:hypothetical protein
MNPIDWDRCSLNDFKSIRRITELWVDGLGLENIMLNRAKRIKKLTIGGKDCTDISFLKGLKHIEKIELIASAVEDISPLLELSKLKYLLLVNNVFITDYYPVHALRKAGKKVSISMHLGISFLKTKLEQSQLPITIPWQPFRI